MLFHKDTSLQGTSFHYAAVLAQHDIFNYLIMRDESLIPKVRSTFDRQNANIFHYGSNKMPSDTLVKLFHQLNDIIKLPLYISWEDETKTSVIQYLFKYHRHDVIDQILPMLTLDTRYKLLSRKVSVFVYVKQYKSEATQLLQPICEGMLQENCSGCATFREGWKSMLIHVVSGNSSKPIL